MDLCSFTLLDPISSIHSSLLGERSECDESGNKSAVCASVSPSPVLLLSLEIVDKDLSVLLRVVVAGDDDGVEWKWGT